MAEKTKNEGEKVALTAEKKDAERQKSFLERRSALHGAELDRAKAAKKLAESTQRMLDMEQQLNSRRSDRAGVGGSRCRRDLAA